MKRRQSPVLSSVREGPSNVKKSRFTSLKEASMPVNDMRKTGPGYLIGPLQTGTSPVQSIVQCLSRKEGTDDFYTLKVSIPCLFQNDKLLCVIPLLCPVTGSFQHIRTSESNNAICLHVCVKHKIPHSPYNMK